VRRALHYLWAFPWTAVAGSLVPLVVATGGRAAVRDGVLEVFGGILPRLLDLLPPGRVAAVTVGYAVLARDGAMLAMTRSHERVHVAQYGRWGPFFPLAYGAASLAAALSGRHYYRDNRFEREARAGEGG
jgi:hypothetical protein